ncbi:MAG: hypothetical protein WBQ25_09650 [Nitrososphaeraceae archaeon]
MKQRLIDSKKARAHTVNTTDRPLKSKPERIVASVLHVSRYGFFP